MQQNTRNSKRSIKNITSCIMPLIFGLCCVISIISCENSVSGKRNIVLENKYIKVFLNRDKPVVNKYVLLENNKVLNAGWENSIPEVLIFKGAEAVSDSILKITYKQKKNGETLIYHAKADLDGETVVEFDLKFFLTENELEIRFDNVTEQRDFYLIHIQLPNLISVRAAESGSKLVIPADAGRLVDISNAAVKEYEYEIDWRYPILSGFVYNENVIGILDTKSIENHTIAGVYENETGKYGSLSMKIMHRLKEYDLEEFGPIVPVMDPKYLLKVQDSCMITVSIVGDFDDDGTVSWVDGSKVLREKVDAVPNPFYKNKTFVRTFVDRPPTQRDPTGKREEIPFDDVLKRIKEFAAQTDSAACVMYLLGWQYEGHDSGYPSVDKVNENLGGFDRLVNLINEAKKYNVTVTFYDNYDDSYPNHPGWDPDVICRDAQGNMMKGGVWEGNQSYLISPYKYAIKSGLDRVRFTLSRYPIQDAYFIDVLAGGYNDGRKYDFNPESPAGAVKNFEGKKMIVEEFNKKGVDVATEDFTGFFVGLVGTFGDIIAFSDTYFEGEEEIPLIPFIYHGKTSFGMKISDRSQYVRTFLYGQRAQKFTNSRSVFTPADYILDALPKQKFYGEEMKYYQKEGDVEKVIYDNGSTVETDVKNDKYSVFLNNGILIAKDYTSFVPLNENEYMACSRDGGLLSYSLPPGWKDHGKISIVRLDLSDKTKVDFKIDEGNIQFVTEPKVPYKVMYSINI